MVNVRFAPSPTGHFHVGGARTALFNYLFAKKNDGKFLLRIEDTDRTRFQDYAVKEMIDSLIWLGLEWDDGPSTEELLKLGCDINTAQRYGKSGGFVQSDRKNNGIYDTAIEKLISDGNAYYVFSNEIDSSHNKRNFANAAREMNLALWRDASSFMVKKAKKANIPYHIRLKMPREDIIKTMDEVRGEIRFIGYKLYDPVLIKTDGFPTYHFASVVDDHDMEITHVIRNEEWIPSLPYHTHLYNVFGWEAPKFIHTASILNPNGKGKMSKRKTVGVDGTKSIPSLVKDYISDGFLPEAMNNFMALTGWNPGNNIEYMTFNDLLNLFDISRLGKKGAAWDYKKLLNLSKHHIKNMNPDILLERLISYENNFIGVG